MKKEIAIASQCGASLGKFILTVERNTVDPNYSNLVNGNHLRISAPFYLYSVKAIPVTNVCITETANGQKCVQFNGDPSLRLMLAGVNDIENVIPKVSPETVKEAIERFESSKMKTIFVDYPTLVNEVTALNNEERMQLSNFLTKQMRFVKTYEEANNAERLACKNAMKDLGQNFDI